jgi:hypothetical protein
MQRAMVFKNFGAVGRITKDPRKELRARYSHA